MGCTSSKDVSERSGGAVESETQEMKRPHTPDTSDSITGRTVANKVGETCGPVWITPTYRYSIKISYGTDMHDAVHIYSSPEGESLRSGIFVEIVDTGTSKRHFGAVLHSHCIVMCPPSVFNVKRHEICSAIVDAASRSLGESVDSAYEILDSSSTLDPPSIQVVLPTSIEHDGKMLTGIARLLPYPSQASPSVPHSQEATTAGHGGVSNAQSEQVDGGQNVDAPWAPPTRVLSTNSASLGAAAALFHDPICEVELAKYLSDASATFAVVSRAYMSAKLLPILDGEVSSADAAAATAVADTKTTGLVGFIKPSPCAPVVFDTYAKHAVHRSDLFIEPTKGFVILAKCGAIGSTYINVLHHPAVGNISNRSGNISDNGSSEGGKFGFIISRSSTVTMAKGEVTVLDVVVQSKDLQDKGSDARAQVAVKLLEALHKMNISMDADFALPNIPGDYISHNGDQALPTPIGVALNLTEQEKTTFCVLALCKLFKQGHAVRNWSERVVLLTETKMYVFDHNMHVKGDFPMDDSTAELTGTLAGSVDDRGGALSNIGGEFGSTGRPVSTAAPFSAFRSPANSVPFQLRNRSSSVVAGSKDHIAYLAAPSLEVLDSLFDLLSVRDRHLAAVKLLFGVPAEKSGWLSKEGHMVKSWKSRFFVLSYGVLEYYKKPGENAGALVKRLQQGPVVSRVRGALAVAEALGSLELAGASVTKGKSSGSGDAHRLLIQGRDGYRLVLQAESAKEQAEWQAAIEAHVAYANRYLK